MYLFHQCLFARRAAITALLALLSVMALLWPAPGRSAPDYVGSETCVDCHQDIAEAWAGSHHALAWTPPTEANVLADFDGTRFELGDMSVDFRLSGGVHGLTVTETDGSVTDYQVHSVIGVAPLQQYLLETEPGRLQSFDVVWDVEKGEWFHLYPDQNYPPDDGLHWSGPYKTWNARCAECHATGYRKNYGQQTGRYRSTQAEIGVGCESCHGPGAAHLAWTEGQDVTEAGLDEYGFSMSFDMAERDAYVGQCAGCHSRREPMGDGNPLPGTAYHDAYTLSLLREGLYEPDGQILDEVYVYGSFLQSRMYARGVGCGNCHDPHGAELLIEGNGLCTQCHSPVGNDAFPTLRKADYDTPEHHFHDAGSAGAQCVSCHMAERTYMGNDGRRDHSFRVPRPDLGARIGAPDTCTDCHVDRDQGWAAAEIAARFPDSVHRGAHYGETLAAGRADPAAAAEALLALALDADQPGIVRATAVELLARAPTPALAEAGLALIADDDPMVRAMSARLQAAVPGPERVARLMPLLSDPLRMVRVETARSLLDVSPQGLAPSQAALLRAGLQDWQRALVSRLDYPETHLVLAGLALTQRNAAAASAAFRQVVEMDPQRGEAWVMLVRLAHATEGPRVARGVLDEALARLPDDPALAQLDAQVPR
ncbi:multiheme c-type cytochrome [Marinibacterium sp. SX1]|uniref:multiheme c-type cytochrome n=1 Tax=Marinibacterium sp. SX1 TaxID=3388424 RepID=UPI003D185E6D